MIVYLCVNKLNNDKYVGITKNSFASRISQHKCNAFTRNTNTHLSRAIRKYGWDSFEWLILDDTINDYNDLLIQESFYIGFYNSYKMGYNMTFGGDGVMGFYHSSETKQKISTKTQGIPKGAMSPTHYHNIVMNNRKRLGKTYEDLYTDEKMNSIKSIQSIASKNFHSTNKAHKEWLALPLDEKFTKEISDSIKNKMSIAGKAKLMDGKRVDISEKGRQRLKESKLNVNNPQYVTVTNEDTVEILDYYTTHGRITKTLTDRVNHSRHIIKRILKENNIL